jgi:DNA-binding NtrC family response regulator
MDFLEKPITLQRLLKTVAAGLARGHASQLRRTLAAAPAAAPAVSTVPEEEIASFAAPAAELAPAAETGQLGSISLDPPLREARDAFERIYFEYHLARENHSMTRVSERTGLERTHLYRKLKQLGIESTRKRGV